MFNQGELITVLAKLPHLESLALVNCIPPVAEDASHREPHVVLPRLSRLAAASAVGSCASLMQHLRVPASALKALLAHQTEFVAPLHTVALVWARYPTSILARRGPTPQNIGWSDAHDPPSDLRLLFGYYVLHAHLAHVEHILLRADVPEAARWLLEALLSPPQDPAPAQTRPTLLFPRLSALTLTLASLPHPDVLRDVQAARLEAGCIAG
ncbi:hypothetical protein BV25DRAFT_1915145 [Artomyces pyxidatus]|uniref:Uncharacterized protein n=1 Tax=Artomyces pyxidatus TaxID=48021 RepID=A0ACB8T5Y4_9AGAM|nr:hypothetical protein BV25DRAFT_1915145 [Artomyces pyxidatus]